MGRRLTDFSDKVQMLVSSLRMEDLFARRGLKSGLHSPRMRISHGENMLKRFSVTTKNAHPVQSYGHKLLRLIPG
jgi:hypothetical protein